MLLRISLIIALIAGLAAGVINFVVVKDKITTTIGERDQYHKTADAETAAHKKFEKLAKDTQNKLDETNKVLVATLSERDAAVARADEKEKAAAALTETLNKTKEERDSAQNDLAAWKALGLPVDEIKSKLATIKSITEERDVLAEEKSIVVKQNGILQNRLDEILNPDHEVKLPDGLAGKVLVVDPKYDFVVLNIGEKDGVKEFGKLIVNRKGKLIAKVQIKSVSADRSVANILPGWKLSDVAEGDIVIN